MDDNDADESGISSGNTAIIKVPRFRGVALSSG